MLQEAERLGAAIFVHPWDMMGKERMEKHTHTHTHNNNNNNTDTTHLQTKILYTATQLLHGLQDMTMSKNTTLAATYQFGCLHWQCAETDKTFGMFGHGLCNVVVQIFRQIQTIYHQHTITEQY